METEFASLESARSVERLPQFFELTCDHHPDDIAVVCESSSLTYSELDRHANQLAHLLIQRGAGEGSRIGILLERSFNTYIALLATLKAGAAFVPLDPSFPSDRVAFIAEDAELADLVTTSAFRGAIAPLTCPTLELDAAQESLASLPDTRPDVDAAPSSVCYIIYTSGSTGRPKGVAVSHANITNFLRVITPIYDVRPDDRAYQGMTIAFDFSIEEIWPTWIAGATLVAGPTDSRRLGHGLAEFLIDNQITVLACVPTLLATVDEDVPTLRTLLVGGEACPRDLVQRWYRPDRRILNTYGPTEATVTAIWCELFPDRPVTIGFPVPTCRVYILDERLSLVPDGEVGEICIGGPGVAIGYINRPDLTTERFVPNPVEDDRECAPRLYRTGDLGRFTASGEIEYLGRIDTQVKIRGYRIELGEIEEVIRKHPAIENAVVTPLEVEGVAQDLAAYVTLRDSDAGHDNHTLREQLHEMLRNQLAAYMAPSFIEVLESFPLLAADKVNRKALPPPASPRLSSMRSASYAPPATDLERQLAEFWGQALGYDGVSAEDDFFSNLGGHSLAAAQVISRLRAQMGLHSLSIGDLYTYPTVRQLAGYIEEVRAKSQLPRADQADVAVEEERRLAPRSHSTLRVLACGVAQSILNYAVTLILSVPLVALFYESMLLLPDLYAPGLPRRIVGLPVHAIVLLIAGTVALWFFVTTLFLPVVVGRLLMLGVRPGVYPLWGVTYLRWWMYHKVLSLSPLGAPSPLGLVAGSPLLPPFLRLLGAWVGRNCHLGSATLGLPMFIEIGDQVVIGYEVELQPYIVEDGWLRIAPIRIGSGAFIGTNSVVLAGAEIGAGAVVDEQSLVHAGHTIPAYERWGGSPIGRREQPSPLLHQMAALSGLQRYDNRWPRPILAGYVLGTLALMTLPWIIMTPSTAFVLAITLNFGVGWGVASTALAGPIYALSTCLAIFACKRAVLPRVKPGFYPMRSVFGLRKWFSDELLSLSLGLTNALYATLYVVPFLRSLGARIGRWAEVSTVGVIDPDMLRLGDESFVADIAIVGPAVFYRDCIAMAPAEIGRRSFVGNGALVPGRVAMGDNSLLGVYSIPHAQKIESGTSWLGSPAFFLPRRQASQQFEEDITYRPRTSLVAWRLVIEYFRVTLPPSVIALILLLGVLVMYDLTYVVPLLGVLLLLPIVMRALGLGATMLVVCLKWALIGRYRARIEPLWSLFVRRTELITALYESLAVPVLVGGLTGTPWIGPVLRLFGARIGRRVWLATTYLTEFDLVEVGDDASVSEITSLQTHLFEDRVMKMSTVKVGQSVSIGSRSVILYDTVVGAGARLDALSLVMKGESLPEVTRWRGIPARAC